MFDMTAILELLLVIAKTTILSALYATILFFIVFVVSKTTNINWAKRALKFRFWLMLGFAIAIMLFASSLSYRQDTGLGDNSKIPVGYGQTIQSEDFAWTYFYPDPNKTEPNQDELIIGNYKIADRFLCAEVSHQNTNSPTYDYIVYDLKNKSLQTFLSEQEYVDYASKHSLPMTKEFSDFRQHYHEYLDNKPKWKTWLLP